ncbi:hypothetical protein MED121_23509 [Marinomonas sp. MED121]|uniref:YbaN family protein n=1 Tax=Marinomonas sp. MED121 TaxID=314277 RepID=UPI0000690498|nr:YbaN family protein [Marinomonas sp. MED121]EAQ64769.1 hypothetical protein MED121_23509 [Marinomonas sp. MED121]
MSKLATKENNPFKRLLLLSIGWISLILGVIGIVLPLLPTTPFILLSAWCFSQSSKRFHLWLKQHKFFGPIIEDWQSDKGIPKKSRNRAIIFMWCGMGLSIFIVAKFWATLSLICIGICVSIYLLRLPVRADS